ncbi:hypothetical protein CFI10_09575 [Marinobacterium iners]|uniref:hypothetical protein n=1 Tax=Marinobacterium iners TaxID=48076 RepID=UPI001A8D6F69|nr:hypothetical protein [Marinobacterium iners]QSR35241.1 hypothetical protein CFI10_09575 [Marinobacterium iners]
MALFKEGTQIRKIALSQSDMDDLLIFAEDRLNSWQETESTVEFKDSDEIAIACLLLEDGLLPDKAVKALANTVLKALSECREKRLAVESLKIQPPKPGRKEDRANKGRLLFSTSKLIRQGIPKQQAYDIVAKQLHKSPDTVRRTYERAIKSRVKSTGK